MNLGPHAAFIVTAYASALIVIAGMIAWVTFDYGAQKRVLAELERQGVTRRSAQQDKS